MSYGLIISAWPSPWNSPTSSPTQSKPPPSLLNPPSPHTTWQTLPAEIRCMILSHAVESAQHTRREKIYVSRHGPTVWESRDIFYATQQPLARILLVDRASAIAILPLVRRQEDAIHAQILRLLEVRDIAQQQVRRVLFEGVAGADAEERGDWVGRYRDCVLVAEREVKVCGERLEALRTAADSVKKRMEGWP